MLCESQDSGPQVSHLPLVSLPGFQEAGRAPGGWCESSVGHIRSTEECRGFLAQGLLGHLRRFDLSSRIGDCHMVPGHQIRAFKKQVLVPRVVLGAGSRAERKQNTQVVCVGSDVLN